MVFCGKREQQRYSQPVVCEGDDDNREKFIRRAKPDYKPLDAGDLVTREYERHGALMEALRQSGADEHADQEHVNKAEVER